jgi:hypothetical protein
MSAAGRLHFSVHTSLKQCVHEAFSDKFPGH